jgi:hypothetical protein
MLWSTVKVVKELNLLDAHFRIALCHDIEAFG